MTRVCPRNIVALAVVSSLFFTGQILVVLRTHHDVDMGDFILDIESNNENPNKGMGLSQGEGSISIQSHVENRNNKELPTPNGPPDGSFNKFPIYYKEFQEGFHSNSHCIGENFGDDAWKYRSCQFQNLCFDTVDKEFVLFTSPEQRELEKALSHADLNLFWPASSMNTTVSVGGLNPKWNKEHTSLKWYPTLRDADDLKKQGGYYTLQADKVLVPWHSLAGFNPGHLVWDDFLPIFTLLSAFDMTRKELALIRYDLPLAMWASCQRQWIKCRPILTKFLPLLGTELDKTSTQNDTVLEIFSNDVKSKYICSPHGAAGMGMLTDHGTKLHGWVKSDYEYAFNVGRGGSMYQFRNWMVDHLLGEHNERDISKPPYRIVISSKSSKTAFRNVSFSKHAAFLKKKLGGKYELDIREVRLASMSMAEQVSLAAETSVFITMCGGGAITAMFMPKGASLLTYFTEDVSKKKNKKHDTAARLDWDLLNHIGYLRVHWLPRPRSSFTLEGEPSDIQSFADLDALVKLVDHELDLISHSS